MDTGSTLIIVLSALLGGMVLFFKNKAEKAETRNIQAKTLIEDASLKEQQKQTQIEIKQVDEKIQAIKDERARLRNEYLTDQQKADSWNKPQN